MTELVLTSDPAKDTATTKTIEWTPPPGAQGYVFIRNADGKRLSSTLDGQRDFVKVAKANLPVTVRALRTDSEGVWPPPVTPPPPPSTGQKVNTNGADNLTIANQSIVVPVEYTDYNIACVYVSGASQRVRLGPNLTLKGGYLCVKQYGQAKDLLIDGADLSGAGGDLMHFDGADGCHVDNVYGHGLVQGGQEHHDYCQIQSGRGYYFGPGCVADWPVDFPNNCYMISLSPSAVDYLYDVTLDRVTIRGPKHGNAIQMFCGGTIISPTIEGPPNEKVTLNRPPDGRKIILRSAATGIWANGVKRSDVYCNDFGGNSGPWPDYVQVDP